MKIKETNWEEIDPWVKNQLESGKEIVCFSFGRYLLAAVRIENKLSIFRNRCPHMGARFDQGFINGRKVVCPKHRYSFDPDVQDPNVSPGCLSLVASRIIENKIEINLNQKF